MTAKTICSWNQEFVSPEVGAIDPDCWSVNQLELSVQAKEQGDSLSDYLMICFLGNTLFPLMY